MRKMKKNSTTAPNSIKKIIKKYIYSNKKYKSEKYIVYFKKDLQLLRKFSLEINGKKNKKNIDEIIIILLEKLYFAEISTLNGSLVNK